MYVPTTIQNIITTSSDDVLNVTDYGAVGDGVTDNASALVSASAAAAAGNRKLFFPPGIYAYNSQLTFTTGNVGSTLYWVANGGVTLKALTNAGGARISISVPDVMIEGIEFDHNGTNVAVSSWGFQVTSSVTRLRLKNCSFYDAYGALGYGLYVSGNGSASVLDSFSDASYLIEDCLFRDNDQSGVWITNADRVIIRNCRATGNTADGIRVDTQDSSFIKTNQRTLIDGCYCWNNSTGFSIGNFNATNASGVTYDIPATYDTSAVVLSGCYAWDNIGYGFAITGDRISLNGCNSENNQLSQMLVLARDCNINGGCFNDKSQANPWTIDAGYSIRCTFSGATIINGVTGISAGVSQDITITGCTFQGQTGSAIGFTSVETDGSGVAFASIGQNALIVDNTIKLNDNTVIGVNVKDGYKGAVIVNNNFTIAGTATESTAVNNAVNVITDTAVVRGNMWNQLHYRTCNPAGGVVTLPDVVDSYYLTSDGKAVGVPTTIQFKSFSNMRQKVAWARVSHRGVGGATAFVAPYPTSVTFTGGGGTSAAGTPYFSQDGYMMGIRMTNNGASYTSAPTPNIVGGSGGGANCTITPFLGSSINVNKDIKLASLNNIEIDTSSSNEGVSAMGGRTRLMISPGRHYDFVARFGILYPNHHDLHNYGISVNSWTTANNQMSAAAINAGGTGYSVGDVLTIAGGTGTAAKLYVLAVSGGAVTSVALNTAGDYSAAPSNPVSVTGGTGSGATFNLTFVTNSLIFPDLISELYLTPSGTISAGTITMPAFPPDGMECVLCSTQAITTLTVQANTGQTLNGAATTLAANGFARWRYRATGTAWHRSG